MDVLKGEIDRVEQTKAKVLYESEKNSMEVEKLIAENKNVKDKYQQAKQEIQYSQVKGWCYCLFKIARLYCSIQSGH